MIVGIIPARYASTRFPGKPLVDIKGKSMIQRVYEQATQSSLLNKVIVATDDERIYNHVKAFGGEVIMTSENHPSGTDRCYDALQQLTESYQYVINIQGDEPIIDPKQIDELAAVLDGTVELATQMMKINDYKTLFNQDKARIVVNSNNEALYFTRSVIPFFKNLPKEEWHLHHKYYRHIGMYAYRADVLEKITALPVSTLEKAESLEQLRWLENGFKIKCVETTFESYSVDTPEDLLEILRFL